MKTLNCFVIAALAFCGTLSAQRLQDVKAIFVAPVEGENAAIADMLTAKLISHLAQHPGVVVVESDDKADATLKLGGIIQEGRTAYGHTRVHLQAGVRLTNKDDVVLWASDVASSPYARSATSSFAEAVAKQLIHAMFGDDPKK